jgi:hypothetical protein
MAVFGVSSVTFQLHNESTSISFNELSYLFGTFKNNQVVINCSGNQSGLGNNQETFEILTVFTQEGLFQF